MLKESEVSFLESHGYSRDDVFDGRGLSQDERKRRAKAEKKEIVLSSIKCREKGHRLRTRHGHCFECKPVAKVFERRYSDEAYVYIAGSMSKKLIKIGQTKNIHDRESSLNVSSTLNEGYAGATDWRILAFVYLNDSGRMEQEVGSLLRRYSSENTYVREGRDQESYEVYSCPFSVARDALQQALNSRGDAVQIQTGRNTEAYEFQ